MDSSLLLAALIGIKVLPFFNVSPAKHASCHATPNPNFLYRGRGGTPRSPPVTACRPSQAGRKTRQAPELPNTVPRWRSVLPHIAPRGAPSRRRYAGGIVVAAGAPRPHTGAVWPRRVANLGRWSPRRPGATSARSSSPSKASAPRVRTCLQVAPE